LNIIILQILFILKMNVVQNRKRKREMIYRRKKKKKKKKRNKNDILFYPLTEVRSYTLVIFI